jgi:predicted glycoside hydrolase/deacetylase ChbG (UPF0249 family)
MSELRQLIVNADDLGCSPGVNRGIFRAHEDGIVTSASLMVRRPAAAAAAEQTRRFPQLALGLHVDLGEWRYRFGTWVQLRRVVAADDARAVAREVEHQLARFRQLVGRDPTHLDSHQHVHRRDPVRTVLRGLAVALGIPMRHEDPAITYCGDFYGLTAGGQPIPHALEPEGLLAILGRLPPGITELGCHPGLDGDLDSDYNEERAQEVETLCDRRIRAELDAQGILLRSFLDVSRLS